MPSGFDQLCRQCGQSASLGEEGHQAVSDFWQTHDVVIGSGTDQLLNHLFLDIACNPGRVQSSIAGQQNTISNEATPLLTSATTIPIPADDSPQKKALFFRTNKMISHLHKNQLLQSQEILTKFQGVLTNLRNFSYEAIKNMDEGAVNDLLTLLNQVEPKIEEMAFIAEGRPKPGRCKQLLNFFNTYQPYALLATLMVTLLPIAIHGIYDLITCNHGPNSKDCFATGMTVIGAGAGVIFFLAVALIYRSTYDPYTRFVKSFK